MDLFIHRTVRLKNFLLRGALILALLVLPGCEKKQTLSITFGGDVLLAREGVPLFYKNPWGEFAQIEGSNPKSNSEDLFFVNLESPLTYSNSPGVINSWGYNLCADESQANLLDEGGVNLVSIENNHKGDCGDSSGENTYQILQKTTIAAVGGIRNPIIYDTPAGKVGIVAAEDVTQGLDQDQMVKKIKDIRPYCDILVVSMHWGSEYQAGAANLQRELAQLIADAGADVLWGHHPHVLQSIEWVNSTVTGKRMLVMFSLGNLLSDQWMNQDTQRSALITLNFVQGELASLSATPVKMDRVTRTLVSPDANESELILSRLGLDKLTGIELISPAKGD